MSTIKVTTIQDTAGGNSSTTEEIFEGRAKAWLNFTDSGTVAIRADYNVNTITDNGTGDYTVNFTTAMPDANYAIVFGGTTNTGNRGANILGQNTSNASKTTTQIRLLSIGASTAGSNATEADPSSAYLAIFH